MKMLMTALFACSLVTAVSAKDLTADDFAYCSTVLDYCKQSCGDKCGQACNATDKSNSAECACMNGVWQSVKAPQGGNCGVPCNTGADCVAKGGDCNCCQYNVITGKSACVQC